MPKKWEIYRKFCEFWVNIETGVYLDESFYFNFNFNNIFLVDIVYPLSEMWKITEINDNGVQY